MSHRFFLGCLIAAAVSVVLAVIAVLSGSDVRHAPAALGTALVPGFDPDEAHTVRVISAAGTTEVVRTDTAWRVASNGGYPADEVHVVALLSTLQGARLVAGRTAMPERLARLDLAVPLAEGAGRQIVIEDAQGQILADIILGRAAPRLNALTGAVSYARRSDEVQSWVITGAVTVKDWRDFVDVELIHVQPDAVRKVYVSHGSAAPLEFVRTHDGSLAYTGAPPAGMAPDPGALFRLGSGLSRLAFTDVGPIPQSDPAKRTRYVLSEDREVIVSLWPVSSEDDGSWVVITDTGNAVGQPGWAYRVDAYPVSRIAPMRAELFLPEDEVR